MPLRPPRTKGLIGSMPGRTFPSQTSLAVVLPRCPDGYDRAALRDLTERLTHHQQQISGLVGAPLQLMTFDPGVGPRWLIGPARCNPAIAAPAPVPQVTVDRRRQLLVTDGPDLPGVLMAIDHLTELRRLDDGVHPVQPTDDLEEAIARVQREIGETWPVHQVRGIDWRAVSSRHLPRVRGTREPIPAFQAWLAELGDASTSVFPDELWGTLPYQVWVQRDGAVVMEVPPDSEGFRAGLRPGYRLLGEDPAAWWTRTAAAGYARPLVAGHRLLSGPIGSERTLQARGPAGTRVVWTERVQPHPWDQPVTWHRLPSGTALLRIREWRGDDAFGASLDQALEELHGHNLIIDLRGNGGGDVWVAQRFRARFLRGRTKIGFSRFREPGGALAPAETLEQEPGRAPWQGSVRFLTDALTYGASEDFLLGLQGLRWVQVVGEPSGGASRRVRRVPLLPGWNLHVATAVTYDRTWRCVEAAGIPVDRRVRPRRPPPRGADLVLQAADRNW